jgi:hypothetical protein
MYENVFSNAAGKPKKKESDQPLLVEVVLPELSAGNSVCNRPIKQANITNIATS